MILTLKHLTQRSKAFQVGKVSSKKTTIGYNPIIGGIPTQKNTIYTALKLIEPQMKVVNVGGFPPITTLDLELYICAQEIRFAN